MNNNPLKWSYDEETVTGAKGTLHFYEEFKRYSWSQLQEQGLKIFAYG